MRNFCTGRGFSSPGCFSVVQKRSLRKPDLIFLPFLSRLRFLEIHLNLYLSYSTTGFFNEISFLIRSIPISLTYLEHLEFNIRFRGYFFFRPTFYEKLRNAWSHLDSITIHPNSSRLQRVDINIDYSSYCGNYGGKPDKDEFLKAIIDGLPLLHTKGILFVEACFWDIIGPNPFRTSIHGPGTDVQ